jgi:tRNA 2-thiouridine synthesizing protein A
MDAGQQTFRESLPKPDQVLEMRHLPAAQGAMCAVLTPAVKAKLSEMTAGQILEIRVNDPTAQGDIASWCRLSGNELLAGIEDSPQLVRLFVRKKA